MSAPPIPPLGGGHQVMARPNLSSSVTSKKTFSGAFGASCFLCFWSQVTVPPKGGGGLQEGWEQALSRCFVCYAAPCVSADLIVHWKPLRAGVQKTWTKSMPPPPLPAPRAMPFCRGLGPNRATVAEDRIQTNGRGLQLKQNTVMSTYNSPQAWPSPCFPLPGAQSTLDHKC